ncbi:SusC/RagA family TonB-linked outer membrane protein [Negadavirga shengliensis]|uniref:SusC/RagA family TonB-linked outer membrane protein n=1 Tax=Negadavirga shengliensis TaxID=1389218 RepID=A0ABV9SWS6_9BACT
MKRKILYLIKMVSKNLLYGLILQCLFLTTLMAHDISAQIKPIDQTYLRLHKSEWQLQEIFKNLEARTDYRFVYPEDILDGKPTLNLKNKRQSVSDILVAIGKAAQLKFKQVDNSIFVGEMESKKDAKIEIEIDQREITGRVTDENGEGIPGATVLVEGTNIGTATDIDGNYNIEVPEGGVLVFSFIGYESQRVVVGDQTVVDVVLGEDLSSLDEIVVVGYGTQKKVNLTGAVSMVNSEEIVNQPVGQTSMALQGIAPGVTITQRSGQPGRDGGDIRIRGIGTIGTTGQGPLIMVDGVETNLNNVDPNEIESISILKDAASASIYGARAANGVVLVTTKRGVEGVRVNYNMYAGFQTPTRLPNIVGALDHMEMTNEAFTNIGNDPQYSDQFLQEYRANMPSDRYPDTDWQKLTMSNSAFMQSHNISVNAGSQRARLFGSINYLNQDGIIPNTDFNRFNIRMNSDVDVTDRLTFSTDIFLRRTLENQPANGTGYVFHWMRRIPANEVGVLSNGRYGEGWNGDHPLARAKDGGLETTESLDAILNWRLNYKFTDWLSAEVMYAPKFWNPHVKRFMNITQTYARDGETPTHFVPQRNSLTERFTRQWYNNVRAIVTVDKNLGQDHHLGITAGFQQEDQTDNWISAYREVFPLPQYQQINAGNRANEQTGGAATHWALRSFFGRATYNFKERYLFEANVRRDGSSRFAEGNRHGVFPSFSAGWRISEEPFMAGTSHFLDQLKLRASWGQLGNQNIGLYPFAAFMAIGGSGQDYVFNNANAPGAALNAMANNLIQWESSETTDIGLEFNLFGKLDVSVDYYNRTTRDILLALNIPLTLGLSAPFQNAGSVKNEGVELMVNYRNKIGDLNYSVMVNYSDVRNEVLDMRGIQQTGRQVNREGYPIGSFFGYVAEGLFQSQEEVDNHATQFGNVAPGDIKYRDLNGDGMINDQDMAVIGSPIPRHTFGARVNLDYKGWDFSVFLQGVGKADGYMFGQGIMPFFLGGTVHEQHKDRWTPDNPNASFPRLAWNQTNNEQTSSFWMRNAAYLRGQNIQLGYSLPRPLLEQVKIQKLRVFISARNFFTVTNFYEGYDPEAPVSDGGWYPQMATYTMGLNVNF